MKVVTRVGTGNELITKVRSRNVKTKIDAPGQTVSNWYIFLSVE